VPSGWVLCDGSNDTPDLRGRFILGQGKVDGLEKRNLGDTGGEEKHGLTIAEIPAHYHQTSNFPIHGCSNNGNRIYPSMVSGAIGEGNPAEAHNNMPPFYVLSFIMKS